MHREAAALYGSALPHGGSLNDRSLQHCRDNNLVRSEARHDAAERHGLAMLIQEVKPDVKRLTRRYFIGGSDARIIMGDDEAALLRLWREKRGEVEPEDLSGNLIVQLGVVTEDLNRRWYEANTGQVITDVQRQVRHPTLRWMAATLDGRVEGSGAVFEVQVHAALVILGRSGRREIHGRSCSTTCGWWRPGPRCSR